jgi:hypothetical protein
VAPAAPPAPRELAVLLVGMNERAFYDASRRPPSKARDRALVDALATVWLRTVYGAARP